MGECGPRDAHRLTSVFVFLAGGQPPWIQAKQSENTTHPNTNQKVSFSLAELGGPDSHMLGKRSNHWGKVPAWRITFPSALLSVSSISSKISYIVLKGQNTSWSVDSVFYHCVQCLHMLTFNLGADGSRAAGRPHTVGFRWAGAPARASREMHRARLVSEKHTAPKPERERWEGPA